MSSENTTVRSAMPLGIVSKDAPPNTSSTASINATTFENQISDLTQNQAKIDELTDTMIKKMHQLTTGFQDKNMSEEKISRLKAMLSILKSDDNTIDETVSRSSSTQPLIEDECSAMIKQMQEQITVFQDRYNVPEEKLSSLKAKLGSLESDDNTFNETISRSVSGTLPLPKEIECSGDQEPPVMNDSFTLDDSDVKNDDVNLHHKRIIPLHASKRSSKKKRPMLQEIKSPLNSPMKLRSHGR